MKLLLHACCGPCSLEPVRLLQEEGHKLAICFSNSNIAPRSEYDKRLAELLKWARAQDIPVVELPYDNAAWQTNVGDAWRKHQEAAQDIDTPAEQADAKSPALHSLASPLHEQRCRCCYALRLEEAASWASAHGFEALSTTLAVSPYQLSEVCHEELEAAAARHGLACIWQDFRPYYPQATRRSREMGMYRQNYCGCAFSKAEAEAELAAAKKAKAQAQAAREEELAAARAERAKRQAAFEEKKRRRREIRNSFRH